MRRPIQSADLLEDAVVKLIYFHQDQVTRLPKAAERLASTDLCDEAGFTLSRPDGTQTVLCLQGHPEFDNEYSAALLDAIEETVGAERTAAAQASLAQKTDSQLVADWIKQFFKTVLARTGHMSLILGLDTGGTFTDAALLDTKPNRSSHSQGVNHTGRSLYRG